MLFYEIADINFLYNNSLTSTYVEGRERERMFYFFSPTVSKVLLFHTILENQANSTLEPSLRQKESYLDK